MHNSAIRLFGENKPFSCMLATDANAARQHVMTELSERAKANMDVVLEETCRQLPHGGDHDSRKFIAERLIGAVAAGHSTLGELGIIARRALAELSEKGG